VKFKAPHFHLDIADFFCDHVQYMNSPGTNPAIRLSKGHASVTRVTEAWYVACLSRQLRAKPLAVSLLGTPIVLYRGADGNAAALLDRCPHRNAPLSIGSIRGENLQCAYHGWEFDRTGACKHVPGLPDTVERKSRSVPAFPILELDGCVWVYAKPGVQFSHSPFRFPFVDDPRYTTVVQSLEVNSTLHAAAENILDVPHTAFLHGGLFRSAPVKQREISVRVTRFADRVEAEYIGEQRPSGLAAKLLAPGGGMVTHTDRFILPCIAQVEYSIGDDVHIIVTNALTPVDDVVTKMFTVVSVRVRFAAKMLLPIVRPLVRKILRQDADILGRQTENIRRFGGERFTSTEVDVLGPHISRLLQQAERGETGDSSPPVTRTVAMKL
jgi:phenylpropionate dioxygenase-like ring-hydroxylating dioxygenase large terminal subunit